MDSHLVSAHVGRLCQRPQHDPVHDPRNQFWPRSIKLAERNPGRIDQRWPDPKAGPHLPRSHV